MNKKGKENNAREGLGEVGPFQPHLTLNLPKPNRRITPPNKPKLLEKLSTFSTSTTVSTNETQPTTNRTEIITNENLETLFRFLLRTVTAKEFPFFSFAFAFVMVMLGTHKSQQQATLTNRNKIPEISFAFVFVIQQGENRKSWDFYLFSLVLVSVRMVFLANVLLFCKVHPFPCKSCVMLKTMPKNSVISRAQLLWITNTKQPYRDPFQKKQDDFAKAGSVDKNAHFPLPNTNKSCFAICLKTFWQNQLFSHPPPKHNWPARFMQCFSFCVCLSPA